jgi:hypothetical protein
MRKGIIGVMAGVMALFMIFTGCENPTGDSKKTYVEVIPAYGNPVVTAKTWEGIILVSWLPVKDAPRYSIWRRHDRTGEVRDLGTVDLVSSNLTRYIDIVSFENQLVNGDSYTYKVVAHGDGTNTIFPFSRATYAEPGVVFNGEGSVTVKANVPDRSDYTLPAVKESDIKIERLDYYLDATSTGISTKADRLLVTWPTKPNAQYKVFYTLGLLGDLPGATYQNSGTQVAATAVLSIDSDVPGYEQPIGYASFPIIAGANTITIVTEFLNGAYYNSVQSTAKTVDSYALLTLDRPTLSAAYVSAISTASPNGYVTLNYKEVAGAVEYAIYKAVIGNDTGYLATNLTTISDWTPVAYTVTGKSAPVYTGTLGLSTITAREELTAQVNGQRYVYLIIAKGPVPAAAADPRPQSAAYITDLVTPTISSTNLSAGDFDWYFDNGDKTKPAYEITLTPQAPNETYKLERAPLSFQPNLAPSSSAIKSVGAAVEVPQTSFAYPAAGSVWNAPIVIHDTDVSARTAYRYFLTITKNDLVTVKSVDVIVSGVSYSAHPFLVSAPFSGLSVSANPFVSDDPSTPSDETNDISGINAVRVVIGHSTGAYLTDKPSLTLFYRKSGGDGIATVFTSVDLGDLYYGENQTPHNALRTYTLTGLDPLTSYDFRLKVGDDLYHTALTASNVAPSRNTLTGITTLTDNGNNSFSLSGVTGEFVPGSYDIRLVNSSAPAGTVDRLNTAVTLKRSWTSPPATDQYESVAAVNFASLPGSAANPVAYVVLIKARWEDDNSNNTSSIAYNGWYSIGSVTKQ